MLGKSKVSYEKHNEQRNSYLREKVMKIKSSLSTGNSVIGNVVIESFSGEEGLGAQLTSALDQAFKREL